MFYNLTMKAYILAVDLGTSFVSAAVVARSAQNPLRYSLVKTFRYPLNLVGFALEDAKTAGGGTNAASSPVTRLPQVFRNAFLKIFRETHGIVRRLDAVLLGLADPFFIEAKFSKKISRKDPKSKITRAEFADVLNELENTAKHQYNSLLPVSSEILSVKINGYDVDVNGAEGYFGKTLEIEAALTFVTPLLMDFFNDAKEKFFPHSPIRYFSDARILRRALPKNSKPSAVISVDGEFTSVFYLDQAGLSYAGIVSFGLGTLARRLASAFKTSPEEASSLFKQYLDGAMEESREKKVRRALESAEADWWALLQDCLKSARFKPPQKFILTGRESNPPGLTQFFKKNFESFYGAPVAEETLEKNSLSKNLNYNPFLTGLITLFPW